MNGLKDSGRNQYFVRRKSLKEFLKKISGGIPETILGGINKRIREGLWEEFFKSREQSRLKNP